MICERMNFVARTKHRLAEILELEVDPKDDPLAQHLFGDLLKGNLIVVDNARRKVSRPFGDHYPDVELVPQDDPELEVHWIDREMVTDHGQLPLSAFQEILPDLAFEDISVWHEGLSGWVSLYEIKKVVVGS